jgi:hypothetical protein
VPNRTLEYFISSPHWLDAFPPPRERYFAKLIVSVRTLLETGEAGTPQTTIPTLPPVPSGNILYVSRRRWLVLAAAAAITFAVAGGYILYGLKIQALVGSNQIPDSLKGERVGCATRWPNGGTSCATMTGAQCLASINAPRTGVMAGAIVTWCQCSNYNTPPLGCCKDNEKGTLQRAMLSVMADTSRPDNWVPAWHPSVWAPFVVVGEGGR